MELKIRRCIQDDCNYLQEPLDENFYIDCTLATNEDSNIYQAISMFIKGLQLEGYTVESIVKGLLEAGVEYSYVHHIDYNEIINDYLGDK